MVAAAVFAAVLAALVVLPGWQSVAPKSAAAQSGEGVRLTLLHNNDGESSLLPLSNPVQVGDSTVQLPIGGIAAFKTVMEREVADARADGNAVLTVYAGDAFLASSTLVCGQDPAYPLFDAVAQRELPYDVHVIGNHEFDYGPDFLLEFINAFGGTQPFLSGNLDFSGEGAFDGLVAQGGMLTLPLGDGRVVGTMASFVDVETGAEIGIVAATTWMLPTISSPRNVALTSSDLATTAALLQMQIDELLDSGINKIILVSHLQDIDNDRGLVGLLSGVDIAVAGGGDELLNSPAIDDSLELLPGESSDAYGTYPLEQADADGNTVYIVTTGGNYKYLGRIDADFDEDGNIVEIIAEKSYPRRVVPMSDVATQLGIDDAVTPDSSLISNIAEPLEECVAELATTDVATTEVLLDVSRPAVRGGESNSGNLIADAFIATYDRYHADLGLPARGGSNPVIAVQNGGGIRQNAGDVLPRSGTTPGSITRLDTLDVLPFANFITVVNNVTPADLKVIFERSGEGLPGEGGQFLQVSGLTVNFDPNQPVGSRVVALELADGTAIVNDGVVVPGAPTVRVVTNNFTADGGDNYPTFANNADKLQLPSSYELSLREYLEEIGTITASDVRYAPGGEGRIVILPIVEMTPTPEPTTPAATPTAPAATPTPTMAAPRPPNTGGGTAGDGAPIELVLAALLALLAGGTTLALRKR